MALADSIDKLLAALPFNGDKTTIGMGLKFVIPMVAIKFPIVLGIAPVLDAVANVLISLGLAHKAVKELKK